MIRSGDAWHSVDAAARNPSFNAWRERTRWSGKDRCKFWHADLGHTEATAFEYVADDVNMGSMRPTNRSKKDQQQPASVAKRYPRPDSVSK